MAENVTDHELYYLRSCLRHLREFHDLCAVRIEVQGYSLADEVLADNINWLDYFIDNHAKGGDA